MFYIPLYISPSIILPVSLSLSALSIYTTDRFFEVATESWPEWDLYPQPLNSVQTL